MKKDPSESAGDGQTFSIDEKDRGKKRGPVTEKGKGGITTCAASFQPVSSHLLRQPCAPPCPYT